MCSKREQNEVFNKYGSLTSYASQRFNHLFVEGLIENECNVDALTYEYFPICDAFKRDSFEEQEGDINYHYLPLGLGKFQLIKHAKHFIENWCKTHKGGFVLCDTILGELSIALNLSSLNGNKKIAIVTDVPLTRANDNRKGIKRIPVIIKQNQIKKFDAFVFLTSQMNTDLNKKNKPYVVVEGFAKNNNAISSEKYKKTCMMAGLLEDEFGVKFLLDSFTGVKHRDAKLVFYGKGSAIYEIEEYSKKDSRISYLGELSNDEILKEESKCTLLINPRPNIAKWTAYSFPSKNLEYISSGTPLVAFKLKGMSDEYDGHYYEIPSYNISIFSDFLDTLLDKDENELKRFGYDSKSWIISAKSPKTQCAKIVNMLRNYGNGTNK